MMNNEKVFIISWIIIFTVSLMVIIWYVGKSIKYRYCPLPRVSDGECGGCVTGWNENFFDVDPDCKKCDKYTGKK